MTETKKRMKAIKVGVVTSNAMDKTVVVKVSRQIKHEMYKRYIRRSKNFMAHDETNSCNVGDTVQIVESRPLSARKRWRVNRVIRQAPGVSRAAE
jgi:small subunit ribosomal protein S17